MTDASLTLQDMAKKISDRFAELNKMAEEAQQRLTQAQADINSIRGAQLDCQYWLQQIASPPVPTFVPDATPQPAPTSVSPLNDNGDAIDVDTVN